MVIFDYFQEVAEGVQFLVAIGSIVGFLGLILGFLFLIFPVAGQKSRLKMLSIIVISIILIAICGLHTGTKYFHIH
ncbi:MAG: hypothetical protein ACFFAO_09450 [Candidatus Hermodarchaeota archaeon]